LSEWINSNLLPCLDKLQTDQFNLNQQLESSFAEQGTFAHKIYSNSTRKFLSDSLLQNH